MLEGFPINLNDIFADDTRAKRAIKDPVHEFSALQQDFRAVYNWAEDVNTKFSTDKFEGLRYYPGCTTAL